MDKEDMYVYVYIIIHMIYIIMWFYDKMLCVYILSYTHKHTHTHIHTYIHTMEYYSAIKMKSCCLWKHEQTSRVLC